MTLTHHTQPVSLLETIGNTPLVSLDTGPVDVPIYTKLETFNPGGSIKDRIGCYIIETLLERGTLPANGTVIEPTAGNTGIGMAIAAAQLNLNAIFVVPKGFSKEKETLMAALGAEIVNVSNNAGMQGAAKKAYELADERDDAVVPQQFANELNDEAHEQTTGPEVLETLGDRIGALVVGIGSGGTIMGMARAIRAKIPDLYVVGVEPAGSMYGTLKGKPREERPYKIEGIGTHDPTVAERLVPEELDDVVSVSDEAAHAEVNRLAREEGHLVGSSSGAASVAAQRIAESIDAGELSVPYPSVVTVFPDGSERYLSKNLYGAYADWEGKA